MTKRAVIITGPGFQDEEYVYPYYRLLEAGFSVEVATKDGAVVYGKFGVPARATMKTIDLTETRSVIFLIFRLNSISRCAPALETKELAVFIGAEEVFNGF